MATSYLMSHELNNLDNEIFHCINQPKVQKKGSNIDSIYKKIIKINDFKEISKDYLLARLATMSKEQKIKIRLFIKFTSYSVNKELIGLQTGICVPWPQFVFSGPRPQVVITGPG